MVQEDLRLRLVDITHMNDREQRHTLELLLREEEEYLKLLMYVRDQRFMGLENSIEHRHQLHNTVLDMLHCPMRTNEKVLTLLHEQVLQGAHKAQASAVLNELTLIMRRLGDLGDLWSHKFEKDSTKVLQKFKLPHDQSGKIFAVHQLPGLREAVYIAIPASEQTLRNDWMSFLHEYVHTNALLRSTDEYTTDDMDRLERHIDACYELLVSKIGGAERGVTNYFHYMGSGHLMWMIRFHGNLWRYCNEGVEGMNAVVSKRYNQFNNKGGNKQAISGAPMKKCLPFEVVGAWLGRLSTWHTGVALDMFHERAWDKVDWTPNSRTKWNVDTKCYVYEDIEQTACDIESDSDWEQDTKLPDIERQQEEDEEDDDFIICDFEEDFSWMESNDSIETWDISYDGVRKSARTKFQTLPVQVELIF